jgi:hypothetical protein
MTTSNSTKATAPSLARDALHLARYYLVSRTGFVVLAIAAIGAGLALNLSWLVAAGIAPVLLTALPCLVMCGLGLCMSKMVGGSCAPQSSQSAPSAPSAAEPPAGVNLRAEADGPSARNALADISDRRT